MTHSRNVARPTRRQFLQQTSSIAAGAAVLIDKIHAGEMGEISYIRANRLTGRRGMGSMGEKSNCSADAGTGVLLCAACGAARGGGLSRDAEWGRTGRPLLQAQAGPLGKCVPYNPVGAAAI